MDINRIQGMLDLYQSGQYTKDALVVMAESYKAEGNITHAELSMVVDAIELADERKQKVSIQGLLNHNTALSNQVDHILTVAASVMTDAQAIDHVAVWPEWVVGRHYDKGQVINHGGRLYRVQQNITSQAHQPPDGVGLLAIYAPIQEPAAPGQVLPWVYGESGIAKGDKRTYDEKVYECIGVGGAGANVWTPDSAASVWRIVA